MGIRNAPGSPFEAGLVLYPSAEVNQRQLMEFTAGFADP
jgi:hypothetical protein